MPRYVIEVRESSNGGCGCFVPLLLGFAWGFSFIMFALGCYRFITFALGG